MNINKDIDKIKKAAYLSFENGKYEDALRIIEFFGNFMYKINSEYVDSQIEELLKKISDTIGLYLPEKNREQNNVVFVDGFGLDTRGLALIYVKALANIGKKITYVVPVEMKDSIPLITVEVLKSGGEVRYTSKKTKVEQAKWLLEVLDESNAASLVLYIEPDNVSALCASLASEKKVNRYLVNLTDHAFWLGANAIDYTIEFRDYGGCISLMERGIEKEKISKLPYYPLIFNNIEFQGFPFEKGNNKVIFSGGALYKTFGEDNCYYKMISKILDNELNLIFWYAGEGDTSELEKLKKKYPERVYWTAERKDLYQVMKHSDLYLSTYPMIGGLMTQYAIAAGIVPVTLLHDECGKGILLHEDDVSFEFYDMNELIEYVHDILNNQQKMLEEKEKLQGQLITEKQFEEGLKFILETGSSPFEINFKEIETEEFLDTYLQRLDKWDYWSYYFGKKYFIVSKIMPLKFMIGACVKIKREIKKRLKNSNV